MHSIVIFRLISKSWFSKVKYLKVDMVSFTKVFGEKQ